MILSDANFNTSCNSNNVSLNQFDPNESRNNYCDEQIAEMPGWISFLQNHTTATMQFDIVDPHTLSHEQLFAYNIVKDHFHQHNGNHDPLYMDHIKDHIWMCWHWQR